jgi:hypothetical protein
MPRLPRTCITFWTWVYNNNDDITVATTIAAAAMSTTAASLLGQSTAAGSVHPGLPAAINWSIAPAFNQVMQNQSVLQSQIAMMLLAQPPSVQTPPAFINLPVQQVAFPMQQSFQPPMQQQQYQQTAGYNSRGCSKEVVEARVVKAAAAELAVAHTSVVLILQL